MRHDQRLALSFHKNYCKG